MKKRIKFSARVVVALAALGLGVVILAACASSGGLVNSVPAPAATTPTLSQEERISTAVAETVSVMAAEKTREARIEAAVVDTVSAIRSSYTKTPTPTPTLTSLPSPTPSSTSSPKVVRDSLLGVGVHPWKPGHFPSSEQVDELGLGWVRFVAYREHLGDLGNVLDQFNRWGIKVILVVNQETILPNGENSENFANRFSGEVARLVQAYGSQVAAWEIWNEPEGTGLAEQEYLTLLERCYDKVKVLAPEAVLLGSGYAPAVNADRIRCDGYAYHLYQQNIAGWPGHFYHEMNLEVIHDQVGVPLWITEFGAPVESFASLDGNAEEWQAEYLARLVGEMRQLPFVRSAVYFGFVDLDNGEKYHRYGLLTLDGRKRPTYGIFSRLTH